VVVPDQKVVIGAGLNAVVVYISSERWTKWGGGGGGGACIHSDAQISRVQNGGLKV